MAVTNHQQACIVIYDHHQVPSCLRYCGKTKANGLCGHWRQGLLHHEVLSNGALFSPWPTDCSRWLCFPHHCPPTLPAPVILNLFSKQLLALVHNNLFSKQWQLHLDLHLPPWNCGPYRRSQKLWFVELIAWSFKWALDPGLRKHLNFIFKMMRIPLCFYSFDQAEKREVGICVEIISHSSETGPGLHTKP